MADRNLTVAEVAARPGRAPRRADLPGAFVQLEPVDPARHAAELFAAATEDQTAGPELWTYMPYGPFEDLAAFTGWLQDRAAGDDPLFFAVRDKETGRAGGMASYLNIHPEHRSIEIGHIWFAPFLQRSRPSTEALYLMIRHAFDELAARRVEWKCNALNEASRRAAERLGFTFEGIFYQHMIIKGRNRDTAWFSILDHEWPELKSGFERWLDPGNFDGAGRQKQALRHTPRRDGQAR